MKIGRHEKLPFYGNICSQLNEYMKLYEYQRSRLFSNLGPHLSDPIFLNFFTSITTWPIEGNFHVASPWNWGTKAVQIVQVT